MSAVDFRAFLRGEYTLEWLKTELDALVAATKTQNHLVTCKHCQRDGKYDIQVNDSRARLDALKIISEQGYGKAPQAKEQTEQHIDTSVDPDSLDPQDRKQLIAQLHHKLGRTGKQEESLNRAISPTS